jgi:hypothetical protein
VAPPLTIDTLNSKHRPVTRNVPTLNVGVKPNISPFDLGIIRCLTPSDPPRLIGVLGKHAHRRGAITTALLWYLAVAGVVVYASLKIVGVLIPPTACGSHAGSIEDVSVADGHAPHDDILVRKNLGGWRTRTGDRSYKAAASPQRDSSVGWTRNWMAKTCPVSPADFPVDVFRDRWPSVPDGCRAVADEIWANNFVRQADVDHQLSGLRVFKIVQLLLHVRELPIRDVGLLGHDSGLRAHDPFLTPIDVERGQQYQKTETGNARRPLSGAFRYLNTLLVSPLVSGFAALLIIVLSNTVGGYCIDAFFDGASERSQWVRNVLFDVGFAVIFTGTVFAGLIFWWAIRHQFWRGCCAIRLARWSRGSAAWPLMALLFCLTALIYFQFVGLLTTRQSDERLVVVSLRKPAWGYTFWRYKAWGMPQHAANEMGFRIGQQLVRESVAPIVTEDITVFVRPYNDDRSLVVFPFVFSDKFIGTRDLIRKCFDLETPSGNGRISKVQTTNLESSHSFHLAFANIGSHVTSAEVRQTLAYFIVTNRSKVPRWSGTSINKVKSDVGYFPSLISNKLHRWLSIWRTRINISPKLEFGISSRQHVRSGLLPDRIFHLGDLLRGEVGVSSGGSERKTGENGGSPLSHQSRFWIGLLLIAAGLYGSWIGFYRAEVLGVPRALALIIISLVVMDGGVTLSFVALGIW